MSTWLPRQGRGASGLASLLAIVATLVSVAPSQARAQEGKRPLDHEAYESWKSIQGSTLSPDGRWVAYSIAPRRGDAELYLHDLDSPKVRLIERGTNATFTGNSRHLVFRIRASVDEQGEDSVAFLDLTTGAITRVEGARSFTLPEAGGSWVAYTVQTPAAKDSTDGKATESTARGRRRGQSLVLRNLDSGAELTFPDVGAHYFAGDGEWLAFIGSGSEDREAGIYVVETLAGEAIPILTGEGDYRNLVLDREGTQLAFLTDRDDQDSEAPTYTLYHWRLGDQEAEPVARSGAPGIPEGWVLSSRQAPRFSDSGRRLFFGSVPRPTPEPDQAPTAEEDERVELDLWGWQDPLVQPMQLKELARERRRSYTAVVHLDRGKIVQLATPEVPDMLLPLDADRAHAVGRTDRPYRHLVDWDDYYADFYLIDLETGDRELVLERYLGEYPLLSPGGKYLTWYDGGARAWFAHDIESRQRRMLTAEIPYPVHDELHDRPNAPGSYGTAGWTRDDEWLLIYDRYDIWAIDPEAQRPPQNLTSGLGRREGITFKYIDPERRSGAVDLSKPLLLSAFETQTKASGFYQLTAPGEEPPARLLIDDAHFSTPTRARNADLYLYTKESFQAFPDLWVADAEFTRPRRISYANPQQEEYLWGSAELVEWTSLDGVPLEGILYKPEDFDPSKKYPMIVYFYERMSDELNRYSSPVAGVATISFSFYTSRGYLVFVPDIPYRIGYPGESSLHAVLPGVVELIGRGFVDRDAIGLQGHSWGGYQITYLITKTDLFSAAVAGAPVVNMTSAYGAIRWATGRPRQFQYEQTQSRIGATLWEEPIRYFENSPVFWADKVNTPLLILHNDEDGAVPWYQGIEYYLALRRLERPVWLLNYNGEGHGLNRWAHRRDFAIRMQQFFDHYLKGAPAPQWLIEGIPASEKGRSLGLELVGGENVDGSQENEP